MKKQAPKPDTVEYPTEQVCAACRVALKLTSFRTGSIKHPKKEIKVCPQCGTTQECND